jgi:hypothetical protein
MNHKLYNYYLTQWSKILLEMRRVAQLFSKFPAFYETRNLIILLHAFVLKVLIFWIQTKDLSIYLAFDLFFRWSRV